MLGKEGSTGTMGDMTGNYFRIDWEKRGREWGINGISWSISVPDAWDLLSGQERPFAGDGQRPGVGVPTGGIVIQD
jgi:hypothetical protein